MNRLIIFLFVILMLFTDVISAQIKTAILLKWKIVAELPADSGRQKSLGLAGPVTGIHNDVLIVAGGANFPDSMPWLGGKKKYYADVYIYEKKDSKIILKKNRFKLPSKIAYAASCSTFQGIVYAGGENEDGISNKVFLLQWNKTDASLSTKNLPDLPVAVTNAAATVSGNIIYIAGGETSNAVSDKFYALDLSNTAEGWKQLPPVPAHVSHSVLITQSNKNQPCIYLIGGRKKKTTGISDFYSFVFEFNIQKKQWKEKEPLPFALSAGTGSAAPGYILIFGGDKGETFHKVETIIAAINAEKDEVKKQKLVKQKNQLLSSHPGFSKEVLLYNTVTNEWKTIGTIPFNSPVTTTAVKWDNEIIIPGGEIRAGVRTPQILLAELNN